MLDFRYLKQEVFVKSGGTCAGDGFKAIKFENIFTTFVVLGTGVVSAIVIMGLEKVLIRQQKNSNLPHFMKNSIMYGDLM